MKNIKNYNELNEEIIEGPEKSNQRFITSPRPNVEPAPQGRVNKEPIPVVMTYTEEEVIAMLQGLAADLIYNYDDHGRGYEFADKEGESEGQKYFDEHKKI